MKRFYIIPGPQGEKISTSLITSLVKKLYWASVHSSASFPPSQSNSWVLSHSSKDIYLQLFHQLCYIPLHVFRDLHTLFKLWCPELHPGRGVKPHHDSIQQDDPVFWLAGWWCCVWCMLRWGLPSCLLGTHCWLTRAYSPQAVQIPFTFFCKSKLIFWIHCIRMCEILVMESSTDSMKKWKLSYLFNLECKSGSTA